MKNDTLTTIHTDYRHVSKYGDNTITIDKHFNDDLYNITILNINKKVIYNQNDLGFLNINGAVEYSKKYINNLKDG